MHYADPTVCPDCRHPIARGPRCLTCGLDLTTPALARVWSALQSVDAALTAARLPAAAGAPGSPAPVATAGTPVAPVPPRRRRIDARVVLLALGALFVLVAGAIFVAVAWGSLGITGRALLLLSFTGLVGAIASVITRRRLRASAEALWAVFFGLLALDWFAAHAQGLFGLDRLPWGLHAVLWSVVSMVTALAVVAHGRRHLAAVLVVPSVVAGLGAWVAGVGAAAWYDELATGVRVGPGAVTALAATGLLTYAVHRAGNRLATRVAVVGSTGFGALATWLAVVEVAEHPSLRELTLAGYALPLLLLVAAAIVVAAASDRLRPSLTAVAAAELTLLAVVPARHHWPGHGGYLTGAAVLVVLAAVASRENGWGRGLRLGSAAVAAALLAGSTPWALQAVEVVLQAGPGANLHPTTQIRIRSDWSGEWWLIALVGLAAAGAALLAGRWPEPASAARYRVPTALLLVGVSLPLVAAAGTPSVLAMATAGLGAGALAMAAARRAPSAWEWLPTLAVTGAALTALGSWWASVIVWPVAAALLVAYAMTGRDTASRTVAAGAAALLGLGTVLPWAAAVGLAVRPATLAAVVAGAAGLAAAIVVTRTAERRGMEVGAGAVMVLGLLGGTDASHPWAALLFTVAGAVVALVGLVDRRRAGYRWWGAGLLGVAWVLRLLASDVTVVEAYTTPFAALLLTAGALQMRRRVTLGSVPALSAGLTLALLPSLPGVLEDPASLRALLLGLAAGCLTAVGVVHGWRAPFVAGATTLAVIALVEIYPYAMAVPRWSLLAVAGVLLLGIGVTWEQRVREGRAVGRYVDAMR